MCKKDNSFSQLTQLVIQKVLHWTETANSFNITWLRYPIKENDYTLIKIV
jgi:hypothetical protein